MTMLLQELVAQLPSGKEAEAVSIDVLGRWLRERCFSERETQRMARHKRRQEFYCADGDLVMSQFVASVFKDPAVIAKRLEWVERAKFNNVTRRVINTLSTVYTKPARRTVNSGNEEYAQLQRACRQHDMMRRVNRLGNLHRNLAVGFRVRKDSESKRVPVIDVVTPDAFRVVAHPLDPSRLIALIFDLKHDGPTKSSYAHIVWTDREFFYLSADRSIITETIQEHGFDRMPWLLFSLEPPAGNLLDSTTGEDLVAAHMSVWLENILLLKESKSATKMPLMAGDLANAARGQALDSESAVEVPEGTSLSMVDMSMDLSLFMNTSGNIYETVAANYGIPPNILKHQGVQSAQARELMLAPLKELREEQIEYHREFERDFADIQSMVCEVDLPDMAFDTSGWRIDFGEAHTPLSREEENKVFEHERRLGLTDTVAEMIRRNPDLTIEQAFKELESHVDVEVTRNLLMRPLQEISGGMNQDMKDGQAEEAVQ